MSSINQELLEISDLQALTALEEIEATLVNLGLSNRGFTCMILDGEPNLPSSSLTDIRNSFSRILSENKYFLRQIQLGFEGPPPGGNGTVAFSRQANGMCSATLSLNGYLDQQNLERRRSIGFAFVQAFEQFYRRRIVGPFPEEMAEFYTRRESTLTRLEDIAMRATDEVARYRQTLDQQLEERRRTLDTDLERRAAELGAEHEKRLQSLEEKEKLFLKREAELEKADNTHARRRLRQDLKSVLKERHDKFTLTAETENKRRPIFYAFMALMGVTLIATGYFGWLASQPTPGDSLPWFLSLRVAISLAGFAGATIFYIRWEDRWSQIHADEEFRLKRLDLDVDRASWLVEVLLEWRGESNTEIPNELIDKLANGLFEPGKPYPSATHPVEDAIASLLASPASLKLRLPGGEVYLDKKSIERAKSANE